MKIIVVDDSGKEIDTLDNIVGVTFDDISGAIADLVERENRDYPYELPTASQL